MVSAPIHASPEEIGAWVREAPFAAARLEHRFRFCVVLSEQGFDPGEGELTTDFWPTGAQVCWLGGPAALTAAEDWPVAGDGSPLAHIVTLDLASVDDVLDEESRAFWVDHPLRDDLPSTGLLQVFFQLGAFGHDAADGAAGSWLVRWTPAREGLTLVSPPSQLELPSEVCQVALPMASFSLPSPLDVDDAGFDAAEAATEAYQSSWSLERSGGNESRPFPVTRLYGHSDHGETLAVAEVLPETLPLAPGDEYRLLLAIESWSTLDGWFGDAGTLEVWMRHTDLVAQRFDRAWCIVRTD